MNGHFKTGSMNEVSAMAGFFLNNDKEMNISCIYDERKKSKYVSKFSRSFN